MTGSGGRGGSAAGGRGGSAAGGRGGTGLGGRGGSGGSGATGGSANGGTGGAAPTFTEVYNTVLSVFCTGSSCHNPGTAGGVGFSTKASAFSAVHSRVTPGNGAGSDFFMTVNTGAMPRGGPKLSATNLALIEAWIDAGASND